MIINGLDLKNTRQATIGLPTAQCSKDGKEICRIEFNPAGYTLLFPGEDRVEFLDGSMSFEQHLYHAVDAINRRLWDDPI